MDAFDLKEQVVQTASATSSSQLGDLHCMKKSCKSSHWMARSLTTTNPTIFLYNLKAAKKYMAQLLRIVIGIIGHLFFELLLDEGIITIPIKYHFIEKSETPWTVSTIPIKFYHGVGSWKSKSNYPAPNATPPTNKVFYNPYHPCMVYLPTFGWFLW